MAISSIDAMRLDTMTENAEAKDPSREELLERARALGRRTWASLADVRIDPLVTEKLSDRVAHRRATLRNVVYAMLGACILCSVAALVCGTESSAPPARQASIAITSVESIDHAARGRVSAGAHAIGAVPKAPWLHHRR
jgi:hypothetical protein